MTKKGLRFYVFVAIMAVTLQSCIKGELPVPVHQAGDVKTASVKLGKNYPMQVYYNLHTGQIIDSNAKTGWSLGFEATASGYHIVLNTSMLMYAFNTGKKDFASVVLWDTVGHRAWDNPGGSMDSTAIGDWRTDKNVYIIDCGADNLGNSMGMKKMQMLSVDETKYTVHFADLNGANDHLVTITKDSSYNFMFLDMQTGTVVKAEPPKATWDIVFTQYTHIYTDMGNFAYRVTGCLLNRYNTTATMDSTTAFAAIDITQAQKHILKPAINTIGFDWKVYTGTYIVNPRMVYLIKNRDNLYYKLHFTDFINTDGIAGFEYREL